MILSATDAALQGMALEDTWVGERHDKMRLRAVLVVGIGRPWWLKDKQRERLLPIVSRSLVVTFNRVQREPLC